MLTITQQSADVVVEVVDLVTGEVIVAVVTIVTMSNSSSLDASNVSVGMRIVLRPLASRDRSDTSNQWTTICQSRSLLAHRLQFQLLALHCRDFLTTFID
jgi:hypothetical protein